MKEANRFDLIAMASFGGHLEELLEMRAAWTGTNCLYVTTGAVMPGTLAGERIERVTDCHQGQIRKMMVCAFQVVRLLARSRPQCIVTTGALPGLIMAVAGRVVGARVIWIDSVANAETLSASGRYARHIAHHHLTQWPDVAARDQSYYAGSLF